MASNIWDLSPNVGNTGFPQASPTNTAGNTGNIWYNGGNYGQSQDWYSTPVSGNIREQNPALAFASWGQRMGIPNTENTFNQWFYKTQLPRFQQAHQMAILDNPMMTIDQFMQTLPGYQNVRNEYNAASPMARGANFNAYAPNVRWLNR